MRLEHPGRMGGWATHQHKALLFWNTLAMPVDVFGRRAGPAAVALPMLRLGSRSRCASGGVYTASTTSPAYSGGYYGNRTTASNGDH